MRDVVPAMACPLPAIVDTVEVDPTTTAGVVDKSATQHACTITAVQSARQIAASRYVGCMAAVATSPIVAVTMTYESKP
jgi:hypothetical protein